MPKPPRVYKSPAIVLRQRKLGDVDKIVTLYTAEFGKVDAVAKGVRRVKSRLAGHIEPLKHAHVMLARGRNLDVVTQVQGIESFQLLRDDLGRLSHALYAAELLDRATEERAENFALYRLLLDTLRRLSGDSDLDLTLRFFEMSLLELLGYRPELDRCVVKGCELTPGGPVLWAPSLGGAVCERCKPSDVPLSALSPEAIDALRALQQGDFRRVGERSIDDDTMAAMERHLRDAIHYALDQDVRSAAFLEAVRRSVRPAVRPRSAGVP